MPQINVSKEAHRWIMDNKTFELSSIRLVIDDLIQKNKSMKKEINELLYEIKNLEV